MKFKGEPNLYVKIEKRHKINVKGFKFDEKGEFETDHKQLIELIKRKFETIEEQREIKRCKKCDFVTDNQGDLLAHYRKEHPKEGK